jgi:SAM-dependent methyltransferase
MARRGVHLRSQRDQPFFAELERYYTRRVLKYAATPLGVDWSCQSAQELRFVQLWQLVDCSAPYALNDLGCGYGALLAYVMKHDSRCNIDYLGIDLSPAMIAAAKKLWGRRRGVKFVIGSACPRVADYSIASGIFNVKLSRSTREWEGGITETLTNLYSCSRRGFAVNFLAPQDLGQMRRIELYRTPPEPWRRFCEQNFGASVDLLGAYGLREFTLLIRY